MADETRSAEVQLSADISAYQRPIGEATQQTNKLTDSVNKLVASLDGITKRAGKKLLIFSAADAAAMTAYTAAAAKYEKQLTTLRAQTELSGKSLNLYKKGIEDIARQMPISGAAVTALVTQINQLGVTSERETIKMARTFTQLAAATGDDIGSLTQGMIELARQMGTLGNGAQGMSNFADSLTTVSNSAGVSATAVLSFSQAIAPMARAAGIGQKEVLGISTAFTKAGADGFAAANTFNSMVMDITRATMSGSPEMGKYATAIGVTIEEFKRMAPVERVVQLFEAVSKAGPDSAKMLDRLGYDGIRAAKSIQAVANESGGLRKAIEESIGSYGNGSAQRGADAAFNSMDAAMTRFRNNLEQIAATIGSSLLPVATAFMNVLNKGLEAVNQMAGPLLQVAGAIGGILAPLSAAFGGLMTMMGPLSSVMLAMTAFRLSPLRAMIQGVKEGAAERAANTAGVRYIPTTNMGQRMEAMRQGGERVPVFRSAPYMWGTRVGGMVAPRDIDTLVTRGQAGVGALAYGAMGPRMPTAADIPPNRLGQLGLRGGIGALNLTRTWYLDPTRQLIANAAMSDPFARKSSLGDAVDRAYQNRGNFGASLRGAVTNPYAFLIARGGPGTPPPAPSSPMPAAQPLQTPQQAQAAALRAGRTPAEAMAAARAAQSLQNLQAATTPAAAATRAATVATVATTRTVGDLGKAAASAAKSAALMPLAYGAMGARLGLQGLGKVGGGILSSIGSLVGISGTAVAGIGAAVGAGLLVKSAAESTQSTYEDKLNITATNEALGVATSNLGSFSDALSKATAPVRDLSSAQKGFQLTAEERAAAMSEDFTDQRFADLTTPEAVRAYIQSMGPLTGEQARSLGRDALKALGGNEIAYGNAVLGLGSSNTSMTGVQEGLLTGALNSQRDTWINSLMTTKQGSIADLILPDFLSQGSWWADNGMKEQVNASVAAMRQEQDTATQKYGAQVGGQTLAASMMEAADTLFKGNTTVDKVAQQAWLDAMESAFTGGEDLGVGTNVLTGRMSLSGVDITGGASLMEALRNSEKGSEARALYDKLFGAETSTTEAAREAVATSIASGAVSPAVAKIKATEVGAFAMESDAILKATVGEGTQDPEAIDKALETMLDFATKGGTEFDSVTQKMQAYKKSIEDTTDFQYTLAQAALAAAERMGGVAAQKEGGYFGNFGYRIQTTAQKMANPDLRLPGESTETLRAQMDALDAERLNKQMEMYQTYKNFNIARQRQEEEYEISVLHSRQDFHRQMVYAEQDFARGMKRAAEDAAKNMMNPYARLQSTYVTSSDTVVSNSREQLQMLKNIPKNLAKLREMGVSQAVIDTLNLTDPAMYQQLQGFVDEGTGLNVKGLNKYAGKARVNASLDIVSEQQGTRRAMEDQGRSMERQTESFERGMDRMQKAMTRAQRNALWDLNEYGKELGMSEQDIITGLKDQAKLALDGASKEVRSVVDGDIFYIQTKLEELTKIANGDYTDYSDYPDESERARNKRTGGGPATGTYTDSYAVPDTGNIFNPSYPTPATNGSTPGPRQPAGTAPRVIPTPHNASGGVVKGLTLSVLGELARPEMIVPLQGPEAKGYITEMASQITTHMVKDLHTSGKGSPTVYKGSNVTITNHTEFRDIKVVAQDPNEMARKLKERERMENMRRGANAKA